MIIPQNKSYKAHSRVNNAVIILKNYFLSQELYQFLKRTSTKDYLYIKKVYLSVDLVMIFKG